MNNINKFLNGFTEIIYLMVSIYLNQKTSYDYYVQKYLVCFIMYFSFITSN